MRIQKLTFLLLILLVFSNTAHAELPVVRTLYFKPTDAPATPPVDLNVVMKDVQNLYKTEMERLGYGAKTFRLETDAKDDLVIHTVDGKRPARGYTNDTFDKMFPELPARLKTPNTIPVIVIGGIETIGKNLCGIGAVILGNTAYGKADKTPDGVALVAGNANCRWTYLVAHELGHAFGLYHVLSTPKAIMFSGGHEGEEEFLDHEARWLSKHPYFNTAHDINFSSGLTFHKFTRFKSGQESFILFTAEAFSPNHLHQAQLIRWNGEMLVGWSKLRGNLDTFKIAVRREHLIDTHRVLLHILDDQGNHWRHLINFTLPPEPQSTVTASPARGERTRLYMWSKLKMNR